MTRVLFMTLSMAGQAALMMHIFGVHPKLNFIGTAEPSLQVPFGRQLSIPYKSVSDETIFNC
jgi:hypothetical protein